MDIYVSSPSNKEDVVRKIHVIGDWACQLNDLEHRLKRSRAFELLYGDLLRVFPRHLPVQANGPAHADLSVERSSLVKVLVRREVRESRPSELPRVPVRQPSDRRYLHARVRLEEVAKGVIVN